MCLLTRNDSDFKFHSFLGEPPNTISFWGMLGYLVHEVNLDFEKKSVEEQAEITKLKEGIKRLEEETHVLIEQE